MCKTRIVARLTCCRRRRRPGPRVALTGDRDGNNGPRQETDEKPRGRRPQPRSGVVGAHAVRCVYVCARVTRGRTSESVSSGRVTSDAAHCCLRRRHHMMM